MNRLLVAASLTTLLTAAGCSASSGYYNYLPDGFTLPDISRPNGDGGGGPPAKPVTVIFPSVGRSKVDILFMVDNSNSMDAMQTELKNRFGQFMKPFQDLADQGTYADLHIGVVTSDYGAGATGAPGCTPSGLSGGGDQGKLIAVGKKAAFDCQRPSGANFIQYQFAAGSPVHNLPVNQGLLETFTCMASVGAQGCGFESQLESVYAALHNNIVENQGFLRDDAILAVVFVTNEDDASAPPETDVFDKNKVAQYGYEDSYSRQTRFAIMCGTPSAFPPYNTSNGPLAMCVPAPNPDQISGPGKQYDVRRYQDFFLLPRIQGGVKDVPTDVVLVGIDAPEAPVEVILSNPGTPAGQPYVPCGALNEASNPPCVPVLQHSCVNPQNPSFFGDPAVRLNEVIRSAPRHTIRSICEPDYSAILEGAAASLNPLSPGCVPQALVRDGGGMLVADCVVTETVSNIDGTQSKTTLAKCAANDANPPCWKLELKPQCSLTSPDGAGITVVRGGAQANPRAFVTAVCAGK